MSTKLDQNTVISCLWPLWFSLFFFVFSACMIYTFFENLACLNDAYGDDCKYTCGQCFNNASCDRNDGTCSNGCEKSYKGSACKQRKYFKSFYIYKKTL